MLNKLTQHKYCGSTDAKDFIIGSWFFCDGFNSISSNGENNPDRIDVDWDGNGCSYCRPHDVFYKQIQNKKKGTETAKGIDWDN